MLSFCKIGFLQSRLICSWTSPQGREIYFQKYFSFPVSRLFALQCSLMLGILFFYIQVAFFSGLSTSLHSSRTHYQQFLALPWPFCQCYFVIFDFLFQGVEPLDYGPGADRQQGAKTRVCSPVLVPGMQRLS